MKLTFKTVTGKQQEVTTEPTTTIRDLKKNFEDEYDMSSLRLCYKGAILEDDKTVGDAGLVENDFVIITGRKKKIVKPARIPAPAVSSVEGNATAAKAPESPAEAAPAPAPAPATATSSSLPDVEATLSAQSEPATQPASPPQPQTQPQPQAQPAAVDHTHGVDSNLIDNLLAMGFEDRNQVALALRAAYMNPDRAVEYLFSGIPPNRLRELTEVRPAPQATSNTSPSLVSSLQSAQAGSPLRSALWTIPQFDQIRATFQQNNQIMPVVLQQIAQRYPQVYQLISSNPAEFLEVMNESAGAPASVPAAPAPAGGGDGGEESITVQLPEGLELTDEDQAAVRELVELGGGMWDEQAAIMVYLVLGKNKEMAASVLFEHGGLPEELLQSLLSQVQGQDANAEGDSDPESDDAEQ